MWKHLLLFQCSCFRIMISPGTVFNVACNVLAASFLNIFLLGGEMVPRRSWANLLVCFSKILCSSKLLQTSIFFSYPHQFVRKVTITKEECEKKRKMGMENRKCKGEFWSNFNLIHTPFQHQHPDFLGRNFLMWFIWFSSVWVIPCVWCSLPGRPAFVFLHISLKIFAGIQCVLL